MEKFKKISFIILAMLGFSFEGCQKENRCDCIKRTGEIVMVTRSVKPFDKIFAEENVNVFITEDSVQEVKVEAGENIEPLIDTEVTDGILYIRNRNKCNWARSYKKPLNVYIRVKGLKYITSNGTGTIKSVNAILHPRWILKQ